MKTLKEFLTVADMCNVCGQTPCNCTHVSEESVSEESDKQFAQRMKKMAEQPPTKGMSQKEKEDKGWAKPKEKSVSEEAELDEEILDVASTYKKIAVGHLKDMSAKGATQTQKDYARKMNKRALEASKMDNHTDALNHYRGVKEEAEQIDEISVGLASKVWKKHYDATGKQKHGSPEWQKSMHRLVKAGENMGKKVDHAMKSMSHADMSKSLAAGAESDHKRGWSTESVENNAEQIDELSINKLTNYRSAAVEKMGKDKAAGKPTSGLMKGIKRAAEKIKAKISESEEINELTSDLLARYKEKAGLAATAADKAKKYDIGHKRFKGIMKATFKQFSNDAKK